MKPFKLTCLLTLLVLANNVPAAEERQAPSNALSNPLKPRTDLNPALTYWQAFAARPELVAPALADLLALDDASFRELFSGSPIKRIGVNRMMRNCLIAAGNSGDPTLRPAIERHLESDDPVVADAAKWASERL